MQKFGYLFVAPGIDATSRVLLPEVLEVCNHRFEGLEVRLGPVDLVNLFLAIVSVMLRAAIPLQDLLESILVYMGDLHHIVSLQSSLY
jgi:hypothetical protein